MQVAVAGFILGLFCTPFPQGMNDTERDDHHPLLALRQQGHLPVEELGQRGC